MPTIWLASLILLPMLLISVVVLSVWYDLREKRIPNWITGGGLLGALALRALLGPDVVWVGFLGGALGLVLGMVFFAIGAMGAGDGKLLATVGCLLGLDTFLLCLPLIGVLGGVLALVVTIRNGTLKPTVLRIRNALFHLVTFGRVGALRGLSISAPDAVTVPYGLAVAAGAYATWLGWGLTL